MSTQSVGAQRRDLESQPACVRGAGAFACDEGRRNTPRETSLRAQLLSRDALLYEERARQRLRRDALPACEDFEDRSAIVMPWVRARDDEPNITRCPHDAHTALRVSNAIAIALLGVIGWRLATYAGFKQWITILSMVFFGIIMVAITIALGG